MKRTFATFIIMGFFTTGFAQSITLEANTFQLPRVSENPACTVEDKGKQVFNTVQNKVLYCDGTAWVGIQKEGDINVIPAFQMFNFIGKTLTSTASEVEMTSKTYDLTNSANLKNVVDFPNKFIAPINGVYNLKIYGDIELSIFTPKSTTKVFIMITREGFGSTYNYKMGFPVNANDNWRSLLVTKDINLLAGERISAQAYVYDPPAAGTIMLTKIYFEGNLIAKQ